MSEHPDTRPQGLLGPLPLPLVPDYTLCLNFLRRRNFPRALPPCITANAPASCEIPLRLRLPSSPPAHASTPARDPTVYHETSWPLSTGSDEDGGDWWSKPTASLKRKRLQVQVCEPAGDESPSATTKAAPEAELPLSPLSTGSDDDEGGWWSKPIASLKRKRLQVQVCELEGNESPSATAKAAPEAELPLSRMHTPRVSFNEAVRVRFIKRTGNRKCPKKTPRTAYSPPRSPKKTKQTGSEGSETETRSETETASANGVVHKATQRKLERSATFHSRFPLLSFTKSKSISRS